MNRFPKENWAILYPKSAQEKFPWQCGQLEKVIESSPLIPVALVIQFYVACHTFLKDEWILTSSYACPSFSLKPNHKQVHSGSGPSPGTPRTRPRNIQGAAVRCVANPWGRSRKATVGKSGRSHRCLERVRCFVFFPTAPLLFLRVRKTMGFLCFPMDPRIRGSECT